MYRPDGTWRTVVDFKTNSVPQGVRDRAFEEWEQIIIDNALLLNAD
ncbi:modulator protein [Escherichia coli]|nr:modulator protein [Escherichia coli]